MRDTVTRFPRGVVVGKKIKKNENYPSSILYTKYIV